MAALSGSDLFLVQQGAAGNLAKATLAQIETYISNEIAAGDTIHFLGNVDLTQAYNAGGQLAINPPRNGDIYINTGTGTIANDWVIEDSPTECAAGSRVLWDAGDSNWVIVEGDSGAGVESVSVNNGLVLDATSTAADVVINGVDAAIGTVGVVQLSDPAGTDADGQYTPATDAVLTEHHYNQLEIQLDTIAGGGITTIIGDSPISVSGTGNTRTIAVDEADGSDPGVVVLTDAPTYNDTRSSDDAVAVTPAGLVANWIPKNWSNIPTI
jgi:hypothetical protein